MINAIPHNLEELDLSPSDFELILPDLRHQPLKLRH